ncbi:MAG: hypothetical protein COT43_11795 [Candidatus Marinimicrobia bacterium CG08_land_8_20_14_0_20_45_22]|nr:MAG: hypothetical protein COT43_11795 [Candidatus Marinimicrobia bacterium CG08_land_8_20_14_0_20_45_22]
MFGNHLPDYLKVLRQLFRFSLRLIECSFKIVKLNRKWKTMKTLFKITALSLLFASILFGTYLMAFNSQKTVIIIVNSTEENFDYTLSNALVSLSQSGETTGYGKIIINLPNSKITANVKLSVIKLLSNGHISASRFIRKHVIFS